MNINEFNKVRYLILADYPDSPGPVGNIIYTSKDIDTESYAAYPHLFQRLEWWEHRTWEGMPKYVKNTRTNEVYELLGYNKSPYALVEHNDVRTREHFMLLKPATQEEYLQQDRPTIESQLRPRYKLIANYPGNVQPLGYIYNVIGDPESIRYWCEEKEKYPQVFQRLEWYEHRTDEELPRYMKYADNPNFVFMFLASHKWTPGKIYVRNAENNEGWEHIHNMFPATEQEFLNQPSKLDY